MENGTRQRKGTNMKTQGTVRYGASAYDLNVELSDATMAQVRKELQRSVTKHLGNHGDATAITNITITIEGQAFSATLEEGA
jgi:hypothetical protein